MLLGCLLKNTSLLNNPSYPLTKEDFAPCKFHQIIFVAINRLASDGGNDLTELEIDECIKVKKSAYNIFIENNGLEFISTIRELAVLDNVGVYYNKVRKFSLLRELKENGFDISDYYDEADSSQDHLDEYSIQDIINKIDAQTSKLRSKYDVKYVRTEMIAGTDTAELIAEFEEEPSFGAFLVSPYVTQLFMGWNKGHLIMNSAPSGCGKSRLAVANLCGTSIDTLWSDEAQDFIPNPNYQGNGLFIHTELKTRREINPMFLACISNIDVKKLTGGRLSKEEKNRMLKAGEILERNQLMISDMPDFNAQKIERKIKERIEQAGLQYCVFDYAQLNSSLGAEYKLYNDVNAREDLVLKFLITELKQMAESYNVGIYTMSQLNGNEKVMDFPDESCLSGAKSMKVKLDAGCITLPVKSRPKLYKAVEPFIKRKGFGSDRTPQPNLISFVYKSRFGEYADQNLAVWRYFDRATMRNIDMLVTDQYNQPVNIPIPVIQQDF